MLDGITALKNSSANFADYFSRIHAEQTVLNGDPFIAIYAAAKPDFVVEDPQVSITPTVLSVNCVSVTDNTVGVILTCGSSTTKSGLAAA